MPRVEIDGKRYIPLEESNAAAAKLEAAVQEREEAIRALREICDKHGDNDWLDDLHLADILEKHLLRHLEG